ncbi:probable G-protein coupled receptor 75 [Aplysia californica]|uniref:Probable G-protein coupled receptor 75 n=1 Tax=Aplysia californica TaxID=6500 RepID=A0ABM0JMB0_APLCA|nr:probable G-protein coupled receptor 75 [Aplysia californica]
MRGNHDNAMSVISARAHQGPSLYVIGSRSNMSGPPVSAAVTSPGWDPSFHGSVHTATLAVCTVLVIFIVILGTFGNGLVLLSALQCRKLRSNFDVLVFNLAGADFIVCSCLSPTFLYLLFSHPPSPREFCGGFLFAATTCGLLSLLSLVAIAAHRQSRVRGRVKGALTTARTASILATIYVISLATAVGGTLHVFLSWDGQAETCQAVMNSEDITKNNVVLFFISPVVVISFVVIVASYGVIARAVRIQTFLRVKALQPILRATMYNKPTPQPSATAPGGDKNAVTTSVSPDMQKILEETAEGGGVVGTSPSSSSSSSGKKSEPLKHCGCCSCMAALDKENKAVTMCLVVILIIALCWTPLIVSHFVELITGESIILYQVKLCGIALVFLNSALDPYMYAQTNGRVKQRYGRVCWDVLRCECRLPSRQKFRTLSNTKPSGVRTLRGAGGPVIGPDCATLQFLHPKPKQGNGNTAFKKHTKNAATVRTISERRKKSCRRQRRYASNIIMFGSPHLTAPTDIICKPEAGHHHGVKKTHAQTGVKTLVHKTCCHAHSPDDQSLIDS